MKRECKKIISSKDGSKAIYVDSINKELILNYINQDGRHKDKFRFFSEIFLNNLRNNKIYKKEEINNKCKDVYVIRLFIGQENDRIYCKEINDKIRNPNCSHGNTL